VTVKALDRDRSRVRRIRRRGCGPEGDAGQNAATTPSASRSTRLKGKLGFAVITTLFTGNPAPRRRAAG